MAAEAIRFHRAAIAGINLMTASTARSFPRHTHDQFGVGVVDSGGHASVSEHGPVKVGPGTLIFVNPGEVHDGHAIGGQNRRWRMIYFNPALLNSFLDEIDGHEYRDGAFGAAALTHESLRNSFDASFASILGTPMQSETALLKFVANLARSAVTRRRVLHPLTPSISHVRSRIDDDAAASLTLQDLAEQAGMSRYQLIRGFARELGLTPHAYILQQRIAIARRLILRGRELAEVAVLAGFYDQSHLNRCFVRQLGVTPRQYALG
jgi:AraC-like DNA-binding protein